MALNLWRAAGKPTAYNPLPTGTGNAVILNTQKDYVVTFKAKSLSGATLRVHSYTTKNDMLNDISLSSELKSYRFEWFESADGKVMFYDLNNIGDIIITDIELVEKPVALKRSPFTTNKLESVVLAQSGSGLPTIQPDGSVLMRNTTAGGWAGIIYPVTKDELSSGSCDVYNPNNTDITVYIAIAGANSGQGGFTIKPGETKRIGNNWLSTVTQNSTLRLWEVNSKPFYASNFQKELGSVFTSYESYGVIRTSLKPQKPVAKQAGGLRMDGTSKVEVPHSLTNTFDVTLEFTPHDLSSMYTMLWGAKNVTATYLAVNGSTKSLFGSLYAGGSQRTFNTSVNPNAKPMEVGKRYKARYVYDGSDVYLYLDDVLFIKTAVNATLQEFTPSNIGQYAGATYPFKGIMHSFKMAGEVEYDFTNPSSIVGDKALQNAKNLIPSFEDSRWQLHANARVYGKDVLRLEATASGLFSSIVINGIKENTNYYVGVNTNSDRFQVKMLDDAGNLISGTQAVVPKTITTPAGCKKIQIDCYSNTVGTFDFIKPELYELSGKEGTVYGTFVQQVKKSKRVLYAKR